MKLITGSSKERNETGGFDVFIDGSKLSPKEGQAIINHSPDGFSWGYGGSGPAQLALSIMLVFVDKTTALRLYQDFKWEVISKLADDFTLSFEFVEDWILKKTKSFVR